MDLLHVRQKFRDLSGRYDLVNADGSDNGANFFINEAARQLDRSIDTQKSYGTYMEILAIGTWNVQFNRCRAVQEVWIATSEGKVQLEKLSLADMIASYFAAVPAEWSNGTPAFYSPAIARYFPETLTPETLASMAAYTGVITSSGEDYNGILLSCPVDVATLVEVKGLFYSSEMIEDEDENFWAKNHPLMLINAAMRLVHTTSGNTALLSTIEKGLATDSRQVEFDFIEQQIAEVNQMEG